MTTTRFEQHTHHQMVHSHEHIHLTHHVKGGDGQVEHLVSKHSHPHDHPPVEHAYPPHANMEREHEHEAHIHDHDQPVRD